MQADLIETELEGTALLTNPMLNKGTAFTVEERTAFALHGLLPPQIGTLEMQSAAMRSACLWPPPRFSPTSHRPRGSITIAGGTDLCR